MSLSHNLFVDLLEGMLTEASTGLDILQGVPGAKALVTQLHRAKGVDDTLPADQEYYPIKGKTPPWSDLKSHKQRITTWVLVKAERGAAVIFAAGAGAPYKVFVRDTDDPSQPTSQKYDDRGGNILNYITDHVGKIQAMWMGRDKHAVADIRKKRQENIPPATEYRSVEDFTQAMMDKFRPLWLRAVRGAMADMKGWVGTQLKSDSVHKARAKLEKLQGLKDLADAIETGQLGDDARKLLFRTAYDAISLTTAHYYEELAGELSRERSYYGSSGSAIKVSNKDAVQQLYTDIRAGDTKKLGTLLAYFKNSLVRI